MSPIPWISVTWALPWILLEVGLISAGVLVIVNFETTDRRNLAIKEAELRLWELELELRQRTSP